MLSMSAVQAEYELNMTQGVTPIAHDLYSLHMLVFWVCVVIGVLVFGVMAYSILHHRKSRGAQAANFHESTTVEIIWTVVPLIILIG
ncbi:MAG: cytochrome c oxidase subunit II transmembrane domain-containing protein, partial [Gammaproteobacteria bacterium]